MQDHRRLAVYQIARGLALEVYAVAKTLAATDRYDLARQLRRGAVSVGSNIAEGCGRTTARDLCGFLATALGSANELEFQLELCQRAALAPDELTEPAIATTRRVQRMLTRLILRIRAGDHTPRAR
jgi:four helix bundle protein